MKNNTLLNVILTVSLALFSVNSMAGGGTFPWFLHLNTADERLNELVRTQADEDGAATPEEMEALRELAEGVALDVLNEEDGAGERNHLQEIAEDVAFNVLDERDESYVTESSSDECAEESSDCCEELCSDEGEAHSNDTPSSVPTASSNEENRNPKYKTQLCRNYMKYGECKFGRDCNFAHGKKQLRAMHEKHKTVMCRNWKLFGRCFYGDSCNFAHGDGELRK